MFQRLSSTRWHMSGTILVLAVSLLWSGLSLFAWDDGVDGASVGPDVAGSLSGKVYNLAGTPVIGIEILLYRNPGLSTPIKRATTNATGAYTFTLLSAGLYRLAIEDPSELYATPQYYQNAASLVDATEILVAGEAVTDVDIVLQEGGRMRGRVTSTDGAPLPNVEAYAHGASSLARPSAVTSPDGMYDIGDLGTNIYLVGFRDLTNRHFARLYPNTETLLDATRIRVRAGAVIEQIDIALPRGGTIQGRVVGGDGVRLGGIEVRAQGQDYFASRTVTSNPDGTYVVGPLETDHYRLHFSDPSGRYESFTYFFLPGIDSDRIPVVEGKDVTGIDVEMEKRATFRGRVTSDTGAPLAGIRVRAFPPGGSLSATDLFTYTDAQGDYLLDRLPPRLLYVEFSNSDGLYLREFYSNALTIDAATLVTAFPNVITDVHASLTLGGAITGTVTGTHSSSLSDSYVTALKADAPMTATAASIYLPRGHSSYVLGGLEPGEYLVRASNVINSEYFDNVTVRANATRVRVTRGQFTRNINFVLGDNADYATLSGTVRGPDNQPLSDVSVTVYRTSSSDESAAPAVPAPTSVVVMPLPTAIAAPVGTPTPEGDVNPWRRVASDVTDEDGQYVVGGLPPDTYRLRFKPLSDQGYAFEYYTDAPDLTSAQDVVLTAHQKLGDIDATLEAGGAISGTAFFADGTPVMSGAVTFYVWDGFTWELLDEKSLYLPMGNFSLNGLQSGRYRLGVNGALEGERFTYFYGGATELSGASDVVVTAGETISGLDISIPIDIFFNGAITGTVTVSDTAIAGIRVVLYEPNVSLSNVLPVLYTTTDAQGRYALQGLRSGNYLVAFVDPGATYATVYKDQEATYYYARYDSVVNVVNSAVITNVNAVLSLGGSIGGHVTDGAINLAGIRVEARVKVSGSWVLAHPSTQTGADGRYLLTGLAPGSYRLYFTDPQFRYTSQYYGGAFDVEDATDVVVKTSATTPDIDLVLLSSSSETSRAYLPVIRR